MSKRRRCWLLRDARGKPSWTVTLVAPTFILTVIRWLLGGGDVTVAGVHVALSTVDPTWVLGISAGLFAQREYVEKKEATAIAVATATLQPPSN